MKTKNQWASKLGFIMATAGAAIGLGNLWKFPYLMGRNGGASFLAVYLFFICILGIPVMMIEMSLGRRTRHDPVQAYGDINSNARIVGVFGVAAAFLILSYYSVIGGWILKYIVSYASTYQAPEDFTAFISSPVEPVFWHFLFLFVTTVICCFGINGIEKVSKIMMPLLVVLSVGIAVYTLFMPGAMAGVKYYLTPNFKHFSATTVLAAMGQLFYSMSLAMGIMITYGSYMKKDVNLETSVRQIEFFDTGIAFIAGLMIIPAVFSFSGGDESALGKGPGLMFITLPRVFDNMAGGAIIGTAFFLLVLFAALTSSISLMETVVSILQDKLKWSRKLTCLVVLAGCILLGLPSSLGNGVWSSVTIFGMAFLDFFDFISNSVLMPIVALLTCIFVGYVIKPKALIEEVELSAPFRWKKLFTVIIKYVAPVCIVLILISSILDVLGIVKI